MLAEEGVSRIEGAHCYAFYAGEEAFSRLAEDEPGTFYLTDFLVRHFDALVIRGLGLDRFPQLRDDYFGNYRRVVHLAQFDDPEIAAKARAAAERLGLAYERRFTGLGGIRAFLDGATQDEGGAMASLTILYWRDIPSQVIVKAGRSSAKRELSERFIRAIDAAAMHAGAKSDDAYLAEWRRGEPIPCGDDLETGSRRRRRAAGERNTTPTAWPSWPSTMGAKARLDRARHAFRVRAAREVAAAAAQSADEDLERPPFGADGAPL